VERSSRGKTEVDGVVDKFWITGIVLVERSESFEGFAVVLRTVSG